MPIDIALRNDARVITSDRGNYWRYYGLHCDPFAPGMLSNEIYAVPRWEEYCDLLHYLCNSSNALLVVAGIKGSGKTTFMHQFMAQLDEATHVCQLLGTPALGVEQITTAMTKEFGITDAHGESLEELSESLAVNIQQSSRPCVLIVDDAHRLHENVLQLLLLLIKQQSESQMRLHILLLGTPHLNAVYNRLTAADGEQELVHQVNLEALTLEETHRYIKHRLAIAGLPAAVPLSQATINRIHNLSEGVIGRINVVARQALIDGMRQPELHAALDFVRSRKTQFIGGGIVLTAMIAMAIMLGRGSQLPHFNMHFSLPKIYHSAPANTYKADVKKTETVRSTTATHTAIPEVKKTEVVNIPAVVSRSEIPVLSESAKAFIQPAFDFTPKSAAKSVVTASTAPAAKPVVKTKESVKKFAEKPLIQNKVVADTDEFVETKISPSSAIPKTVVPKQNVVPAAKKVSAQTSAPALMSGWLQKANPQHYTVQLIGLSTEQGIRNFIADNHLGANATYIRTHRRTKDWYVLVIGQYDSIQQAQAAIQNMPKSLQGFHPWVRKIAALQQTLNPSKA